MCSVSLREAGDLNEHIFRFRRQFRDFFRFSKVFKLLNKLMEGAAWPAVGHPPRPFVFLTCVATTW